MARDNRKTGSWLFPDVPSHALVGSYQALNLPQKNGGPGPRPTPVSAPDVAIQISPCLEAISRIAGTDISAEVYAGLKRFGRDVRHQCAPKSGMTESVETIGIWEFHPDNAEADAARTAALEQLQLLKAPGIAFFFARSFLNRRIGQAFDSLPTKRFDTNGAANPNGAVHMTGISFDLNPPKQIVTYIDGFDDTTFPDTNFRISITDDLIINEQSALSCNESINMDTDTGVLEVLSGIFIPFVFELIAVELLGGAPQSTPADCWVQVLSQNDIPVSGGWDIVITYTDVNVTYEGLVLTARFPGLSKRTPSVEIIGRRNLTDNLGEGVVGSKYSAQLLDFLEPVQIEWFVDSNLVAKGTGEQFVTRAINFMVPRGKSVMRQLMVRAVDADNLTSEDKTSINISSRARPSPPP